MNFRQFVKLIKKDEGSGLILALMTLMVLSILGAALGAITIGSHKLGNVNRDDNSAYYIAEAGAQLAYEEFSEKVMDSYSENNIQGNFFINVSNDASSLIKEYEKVFDKQFGSQPKAIIEVIGNSDVTLGEYSIKSTGIIEGKQRTVEMPLKINWIGKGIGGSLPGMPGDVPTLAKHKIKLDNQSKITGDIYIDKEVDYEFINEGEHNGELVEVYIVWDQYYQVIDNFPDINGISYETEVYDGAASLVLETNTYFNDLSFSKNNKYTIDTKDQDIYIITDDLHIGSKTQLEITGKGSVNFLVTDTITIDNNAIINSENIRNKMNLLYSGANTAIIPNGAEFNGSIFVQSAPLVISNNALVNGIILSGGTTMNFAQNTIGNYVVVAPYANILFENNTEIYGSIIADSFEFSKAELQFKKFDLTDYPFGSVSNEDAVVDFPSGTEVKAEDIITIQPAIEN